MVVAAVYTRNIQYIMITSLLPSFKLVISVFSTYTTTRLFIVSSYHIYPAWKIIFTIWQNMKARELQKSLGELEVQPNTKIQKSQSWIYWLIGKSYVLI